MAEIPQVTCELKMVGGDDLFEHILTNATFVSGPDDMLLMGGLKGKTVMICGAGPSLKAHHDYLHDLPVNEIWACNSALPYLSDQQLPVSHGFCVDQSVDMLKPAEWERTFDVTYLLGTCVHPDVTRHLLAANRCIKWFHNFLGIPSPKDWTPPEGFTIPAGMAPYEWWLYCTKFPPSAQVGYGLNSVPRAICLALGMGVRHVTVLGADCAAAPNQPPRPALSNSQEYADWSQTLPLYASGRTVAEAYGADASMCEGLINGRRWVTRTDMLISAKMLVDIVRAFPNRVTLVGDTLPNALLTQPQDFLDTLPRLNPGGVVTGFRLHKDLEAQIMAQQAVDNPKEAAHVE